MKWKSKQLLALQDLIFELALLQVKGKFPLIGLGKKNHDVIAFPELFCDGKGGLNAERKIKLTMGDFLQYKARLT